MPKPEHPTNPDVEISAKAKVKEMRHHRKPTVVVRARVEPDGECSSGSDRTNLPDEVEPGVTYRDVRIDFRVAAALADPQDGERRPCRDEPGETRRAGRAARDEQG